MVPLTAVGGGDFDDGAQKAHGTPQRASEQAFALHGNHVVVMHLTLPVKSAGWPAALAVRRYGEEEVGEAGEAGEGEEVARGSGTS